MSGAGMEPGRRGAVALVALLLTSAAVLVVLLVRSRFASAQPASTSAAENGTAIANVPSGPAAPRRQGRPGARGEGSEGEVTSQAQSDEHGADARPRTGSVERATAQGAPPSQEERLASADGRDPGRRSVRTPGGVGYANQPSRSAGQDASQLPGSPQTPLPVPSGRPADMAHSTHAESAGHESPDPQSRSGSHADSRAGSESNQDSEADSDSDPDEEQAPTDPDPSQDRNPPVLDQIRFDPPQVADGAVATLSIHASDDLSGVASVRGMVTSPSGRAVMPFQAQIDPAGSGTFAVPIPIPSKAENGFWYVSNLMILDRASNPFVGSYTAANAPPGGMLKVTSSDSDSDAPELVGIWIQKPSIAGGERNALRIEARDDRSGVAAVKGSFGSPSNNALVPFNLQVGPDTSSWEGEVAMPTDAECGTWNLQILRLTDNAGNNVILQGGSPQLAGAGFTVAGGNCDATTPTLRRIELSPAVVSNDTESHVLLTAEFEDGSRVIAMSGWMTGPPATNGQPPHLNFTCTRSSADPQSPWTGTITVNPLSAKGIWRVGLLRLQDRSSAWKDYNANDPALAQAVFEVR